MLFRSVAAVHKTVGQPGGIELDLGGGPAGTDEVGHLDGAGGIVGGIPLNAQVGCNLADDVSGDRGHNLGGVVIDPAGIVQHDQNQNLGVVGGQDGGKADGLAVVPVGAVFIDALPVQLFAGAGLAADAVARHIGVAAFMGGVVDIAAHVVLHHHADLLADLLAHHLTADFGFRLPDHVAGIIGHVVHHIRGDQVTAVDGGRHSRGHLDQGELLGLTEGGGIEVGDHVLHFLLGFGDAPGLKGQVNSGGLGQAKGLIVVIEEIRIHLLGCLDKVEVAALVERPRHVQPAVGAALGAAVGVLPFGTLKYRQAAAAVKLLAGIHQAGIQRGGGRHKFKDRAGIIQFCHSLVFPLGLPDHALKRNFFAGNFLFGPVVLNLGAGLGADHAVGNQIRHVVLAQAALQGGDLLRREGAARVVQDGLEFGFRDGIGIIGVELGLGGHAINGAGLDIHHNGAAAVLDIVILNGLGQLGFQNALDIIVDGQVKIGAVDGIMGVGFLVGQLIAPGVLAADGAARRAGKLFVIGFFQPSQLRK